MSVLVWRNKFIRSSRKFTKKRYADLQIPGTSIRHVIGGGEGSYNK
jgi:hypothetical protein